MTSTGIRQSIAWALPALLVLILGGLILSTYPKVSPFDELQHLDSSIKASQGRWFLPPGELFGQDAMRLEACVGVDYPDYQLPPCDSETFNPTAFQEWGINTAAGRPSLYYVITGYSAQALSTVTDLSFLTAARIMNLLALAVGAALLAWGCLRLSGSVWLSASLAVIVSLVPPVLSQGIIVNPDSWSIMAGAAVTMLALAAVRWSTRRTLVVLTVATTLTILIKPNFLVLAIVPVVLLGFAWWRDRTSAARHRWVASLVAAAVACLVFIASMVPTYLSDNPSLQTPQYILAAIPDGQVWPFGQAVDEILRGLLPLTQIPPVDAFESLDLGGVAMAAMILLVSGSVAAVILQPSTRRLFALGVAGLLALLATPALVYAGQFVSGIFFFYPQRYSIVVFPVLALTWAASNPRRPWIFVTVAVVVALTPVYAYLRF